MISSSNFIERSSLSETSFNPALDQPLDIVEKITAVVKKSLKEKATFVLEDPKTNKLIKKITGILNKNPGSSMLAIEKITNLCLQKLSPHLSEFHQNKISMLLAKSHENLISEYKENHNSNILAIHEQLELNRLHESIQNVLMDLHRLDGYPQVSAHDESFDEEPFLMQSYSTSSKEESHYLSPAVEGYEYWKDLHSPSQES